MQAGPRLRSLGDAFGVFLIREHVRVAASVPIVQSEGVAGEHSGQPRAGLGFLLRQALRPSKLRAGDIHRPLVVVIFTCPVHPPGLRRGRLLAHLDEPHVGIASFLLALEDVHQERQDEKKRNGAEDHYSEKRT
jgi:hypothetical protein